LKNNKRCIVLPINLYRRALAYLLSIVISFGILTGLPVNANAAESASNNKESIYVALGDSVPAGYALSDPSACCVQQFSDLMTESGYPNSVYNYAVSGITTGELLTSLQNMQTDNPEGLNNLQNASVITVNIGGNNMLGPLIEAVNANLSQKFIELGITDIASATQQQLITIGLSLYNLKLSDDQLGQIEQGVADFATDFPQIIKWLKNNAPCANIIVNTIYNPIPSQLGLYKTSETLLSQMNQLVTSDAENRGYSVVDIYSAFKEEQTKGTQILNLNLGQYKSSPVSVDIHPNIAGHDLIAKQTYAIFKALPILLQTTSGSPITVSQNLDGTLSKGALSLTITEPLLSAVIEKANAAAKSSTRVSDGIALVISNSSTDVKSISLKIDEAALKLLKSSKVKSLSINTTAICYSLNNTAIGQLAKKTKGNVTIKMKPVTKLSTEAASLVGSRPVFKITVTDDKKNSLSDFGKGLITISIRYTAISSEKSKYLHMVTVSSKGKAKLLTKSTYQNGWISCTSSVMTTFGVGYKK